jgi:hypothetical protein
MHCADGCFIQHGPWSRQKTHEEGIEGTQPSKSLAFDFWEDQAASNLWEATAMAFKIFHPNCTLWTLAACP